ncbi:MAG: GAF domain-containing protein, partial [Chitinophagaceae bacterium]|nr:GAF domain-containing protein [Rubrivivax sp.]
LGTVTEATRKLLAGHDFDASVNDVVRFLGTALGVIRAALVKDLTPQDMDDPGRWRVTHQWSSRNALAQRGSWAEEGPWPSVDFRRRMWAGEVLILNTTMDAADGLPPDEERAGAQDAVDTLTILPVPIFVHGRCWGGLGLTDSPVRQWADHEIQVLKAAASCVGAALERQAAEADRLTWQQRRTAEAQALNHLLEGVVQASRAMLDETDFRHGRQRWLELLRLAVGADCALLGALHDDPTVPGVANMELQWSGAGDIPTNAIVPATTDFVDWADRLRRGEVVWEHSQDLLDPASLQFWQNHTGTSLLLPVLMGGRTVGWLGFSWRQRREWQPAFGTVLRTAADSLAAAMQRQQAMQAMLAERDRRIDVEQARASEAARQAARSERHSYLLAAVGLSAEELVAVRHPEECLERVLTRIGTAAHAERARLARIDWLPADPVLHGWQHITHEWTRHGGASQADSTPRRIALHRSDAGWARCLRQLQTERRCVAESASLDEPSRGERQRQGIVWSLCYPVLLEGRVWGLLGLDYATPCAEYDEDDLNALQTVASTIGDALSRVHFEKRALDAERARANESTHLADLLAHVVRSSRTLIDAGCDEEFEPAMLRWLAEFGHVTEASRTAVYGRCTHEVTGAPAFRALCHWVRPGNDGSVQVDFAPSSLIDAPGAEGLLKRLASGQVLALHTDELTGAIRDHFIALGNATVIAVPIYIDRKPWGCLSFDHDRRRELNASQLAVLQTAADTLAAILKRNETARALMAEREARLIAERARSHDLAQANDALRASLTALGNTASEGGFLSQSLLGIRLQACALVAYLFRCDGGLEALQLVGSASARGFSARGEPGDPDPFLKCFHLDDTLADALVGDGRLVWRSVDAADSTLQQTPDAMAWHLRQGHRACALHALLVGKRLVGLVWLVFDDDRPLSDVRRELIHALCQPLALVLELAKLARSARRSGERAAVLTERHRLAREIHDGIAQSFIAIQMQLAALDGRDGAAVGQALKLARHGMTEARRAVAALRPHELLNRDLPRGVQRLLAQMTRGTTIVPQFEHPPAWTRLPLEVEDHLFRIVQEAMNNVLKHAKATAVRIELSQAAGETTVLVADDGIGFDPHGIASTAGYGAEGMQQRARLIGARVDVTSCLGKGTQVLVSWTPPSELTSPPPAGRA